MALTASRYGKDRVRVLRLTRSGDHHVPRELTLSVILTGRFEDAWTRGDNRACIATDSVKNIVNVTAARNPSLDAEAFVAAVSDILLDSSPPVAANSMGAEATGWLRTAVAGVPHGHTFTRDANGYGFVALTADRDASHLRSGLRGFTFMKTTQSGWAGFVDDSFRTLPDTADRIAATSMDATWSWATPPADYGLANARILATLLRVFATTYSRGIQDSMYRMGEAALADVTELADIAFVLPNRHYLPIDLRPFGLDSAGAVFLPTEEPYGRIEATVSRSV